MNANFARDDVTGEISLAWSVKVHVEPNYLADRFSICELKQNNKMPGISQI